MRNGEKKQRPPQGCQEEICPCVRRPELVPLTLIPPVRHELGSLDLREWAEQVLQMLEWAAEVATPQLLVPEVAEVPRRA